jgi:hypothetical protein
MNMTRKTGMLIAVTCVVSLAVGVLIGQGLRLNGLTGTAAMNPTKFSSESSLQALTLQVCLETAKAAEEQVKAQLEKMNVVNASVNSLVSLKGEIRGLVGQSGSSADKLEVDAAFLAALTSAAKTTAADAGIVLAGEQAGGILSAIDTSIASMTSQNQMEMIRMQNLLNESQNSYTTASNIMKSITGTQSGIIGNMR